MFIIAISKTEKDKLKNIIKKINEETSIKVIFMEDYIIAKNKLQKGSVVYVINNDERVFKQFINSQNVKECKIINKQYYLKNLNKEKIQQILNNNNILVPKIFDYNNLNNNFPVMCKSKNHTIFTGKFDNKKTLEFFLQDKNIDDFYFEEVIDKNKFFEYKLYFVNKEFFFYDDVNKLTIKNLSNVLNTISSILNLEVYSIDIFTNGTKTFIIDINPSAGFYKSKQARKKLISII